MKRLIICGLLTLLLTGCLNKILGVTLPGDLIESQSEFDGSRQVVMEPLGFNMNVCLGLFWRSTMKPGEIILEVRLIDTKDFAGNRVALNIDGQIHRLTSLENVTNFEYTRGSGYPYYVPGYNTSNNRYLITEDFLRSIINAEKAVIRIDHSPTFSEANLANFMGWDGRSKLQAFLDRVAEVRKKS